MSLHVQPIPPIPEETYHLVRRLLGETSLMVILGDQLSSFLQDADFADLYSKEGQPALSPGLLARVTLLQFMENLSDRQAVHMVITRLDWKYVLHLPLEDAGFDPSVLCEFRARLLRNDAGRRTFDRVLVTLREKGLLKGGRRQRTDSLSVLGAVRVLSRLELAMETVRTTLGALEAADPLWLSGQVPPEWAGRYGEWTQEERLVSESGDRGRAQAHSLLERTGRDLCRLLEALDGPDTPEELRRLPAVGVARTVFDQQWETSTVFDQQWEISAAPPEETPPAGDGTGGVRGGEGGVRVRPTLEAAGAEVIRTPHDPDVRWSEKRGVEWEGYKVHLTETVEEDQPRIITDLHTTPATTPDSAEVSALQDRLRERGLPPEIHLMDRGYVTGENLAHSEARGIRLVGPALGDTSPQARLEGGVTLDQFEIDAAHRQARCPGGAVSVAWSEGEDDRGRRVQVAFGAADCRGCPLHDRCVVGRSGQGRRLHLREYHEQVSRRRREERTEAFRSEYAARSGVEASLSEEVREYGLRRARYRGQDRVQLQHLMIGAATNLRRAARWLRGDRPVTHRKPTLRILAASVSQSTA